MPIFPPWPISSYQHEVTDCRVGKRPVQDSSSKPLNHPPNFSKSKPSFHPLPSPHLHQDVSSAAKCNLVSFNTDFAIQPLLSIFTTIIYLRLSLCPVFPILYQSPNYSPHLQALSLPVYDWKINLSRGRFTLCHLKPSIVLLLFTK